jgi:hypothetical protein
MKKILLLSTFIFTAAFLTAQSCSKPFISKYVEGYSNNRAVEIYNPTSSAIDLSLYSIGRFSNGSSNFQEQQFPAVMLQPYDTYLAVIDKTDSLGTCFEIPVWNGYQMWDTCRDGTTNLPIIDTAGNVVFCVQYELIACSGGDIPHHRYGSTYNDFLDLAGRADAFFDPTYDNVNPMYFNGNDAVALIEGTSVDPSGNNILDVVGVISEDPAGGSWTTNTGYWVTKNRTIVRKPNIEAGKLVVKGVGVDTMPYNDWEIFPNNTFYVIDGDHDCSCDPSFVSTKEVNINDFNIYPNPATANRMVMIEAEAAIESVEIFNILGQTVATQQFNNSAPRQEVAIPNVNTGVYLMSIRFKDNTVTTRKLSIH